METGRYVECGWLIMNRLDSGFVRTRAASPGISVGSYLTSFVEMSHDNPTPLRIGTSGTLNGWRVQVAGRLVMSMQDRGQTWYWNEFHLLDEAGTSATLVFEETEDGAEWK